MTTALKLHENNLPADPFKWKTRDGRTYEIVKMTTTHLFNTISMIWNHSMPKDVRTHNFNQYAFGKSYTRDYMMTAVRLMLPELLARPDLSEFQLRRLQYMHACLLKNPMLGTGERTSHDEPLQQLGHNF